MGVVCTSSDLLKWSILVVVSVGKTLMEVMRAFPNHFVLVVLRVSKHVLAVEKIALTALRPLNADDAHVYRLSMLET